jgi:hypothetical protein
MAFVVKPAMYVSAARSNYLLSGKMKVWQWPLFLHGIQQKTK